MLAIGRALLTNPKLLIMDEPSEGLAPAIIENLIEVFRTLEAEGLAILLIEQNLGVATALANRQLVMVAGSIFTETTADALAQRPRRTATLSRGGAARRDRLTPAFRSSWKTPRWKLDQAPDPARGRR